MNFFLSSSTWYLIRSLRLLVKYEVDHSKRNSKSTRIHVLSLICYLKRFFFALFQWLSIARTQTFWLAINSLWTLLFYYLQELKRLVLLSFAVKCFTLCSIKSWCEAAFNVKSIHSVYTSNVVLTGMTCAVIDICFEEKK